MNRLFDNLLGRTKLLIKANVFEKVCRAKNGTSESDNGVAQNNGRTAGFA